MLRMIGEELGSYMDHDAGEGRVRVQTDALKPLVLRKSIQFSKGEAVSIEFEYEKLKNHCFRCLSLANEEKNCPVENRESRLDLLTVGINQQRTLHRLESDRKRHEDKRDYLTQKRQALTKGDPIPNREKYENRSYQSERRKQSHAYNNRPLRGSYEDYQHYHRRISDGYKNVKRQGPWDPVARRNNNHAHIGKIKATGG